MDTIRLPRPATSTPVETAMAARHTSREFAARELSDQHLSDLLWAMYGVNRPDGKRTVPASMGLYILDIYVVRPDGIYLFNPEILPSNRALKAITAPWPAPRNLWLPPRSA